MTSPGQWVIIGKLGSPQGVKGWIKLQSFSDPPENIMYYQPWQLQTKTGTRTIQDAEVVPHGRGFLVKLVGCDDRNAAQLWTNATIAVTREQLPALPAGEYYWQDLQGMTVINLAGIELGKIEYIHETGANDVMVVQGQQQYLIPYLSETVVKMVDLATRTMQVDWDVNF